MRRLRTALLIGSLLLYPALVHLFVVLGSPEHALIVLLGVSLLMLWGYGRRGGLWPLVYASLAAAAALGLVGGGHRYALYAPPLVFNLWLAMLFGASLLPRQVPLIEGFMRRLRGADLPSALVAFARRLTWVWMLFFASMAVVAFALALFASLEARSLFANVINYLLVAGLFFWKLRSIHPP